MASLGDQILSTVRKEIARYDLPENQLNYQKFFKEPLDNPMGLKTPILRKIFASCFRQFRHYPERDIFDACDQLLASKERYMSSLAFLWTSRLIHDFRLSDFDRFESWLQNYVSNWGECDSLSGGPLGLFVQKFPQSSSKIYRWTKSENRWFRRASAVSLILSLRKGSLLQEAFRTADALLLDEDDMVQKGYGWMLKEATNVFPEEVIDFVDARKARMPRTALRYAIEKLPATKRKRLMR
jgi:3-methyladenine DNA glycosylase AlkD